MGLLGHAHFPVEKANGAGTVPVHAFHAEHEHDGWSCVSQMVTMSWYTMPSIKMKVENHKGPGSASASESLNHRPQVHGVNLCCMVCLLSLQLNTNGSEYSCYLGLGTGEEGEIQ